jgi:hypothetical protein
MVPNYPVIPLSDVSVAPPSGDSGTITVDVRGVRPGTYIGYLVGVTGTGITSSLMRVGILVRSPYSLSVEADWGYSNEAVVTVSPHWMDGSTAAQSWIASAAAFIGGVQVGAADGLTGTHDSLKLTLAEPGGGKLPVGDPTVTIRTTDNFGVDATVLTGLLIQDRVSNTFGALVPRRLLDTRTGNGAPKSAVLAGRTLVVQVAGRGGVPASGVAAVVLNVTVTAPTRSGAVTVYADGSALPSTSNLNFVAGQTVPNLVVARLGADGKVDLHVAGSGSVQLIADVSGYLLAG